MCVGMCFVNFQTLLLTFPIYPLNSHTLNTRHLGIYTWWRHMGEWCIPWVSLIPWWRQQMEHFPTYWPFVRGIHRWPVNSPHKGQWCGALMFSFISAWSNSWVNNCDAGDLKRHRIHYDVIVMSGNGLSPVWRQGLPWPYADWFSIWRREQTTVKPESHWRINMFQYCIVTKWTNLSPFTGNWICICRPFHWWYFHRSSNAKNV